MTLPDIAAAAGVAIDLERVTKIYRLFASRTEHVLDGLGLRGLAFWRRPAPPREHHALDAVDLRVGRGERIAVIGRNGAGKTTLLKLITGNFTPTSGRVTVNGTVQALMQTGLGFHPDFTGYENIRSALQYNGLSAADFDRAVDDIIDFCELGEYLHQPVQTYSLGMRARLQFATATAVRPDILIVDEVLGAGDAYFSGKSSHRMEALTRSGCTLLLVSHSMQQVLQFCDRAIWLERGRIVRRGTALEVVRAYEESIQQQEHARRLAAAAAGRDNGNGEATAAAPREPGHDFATPRWQQERLLALVDGGTQPSGADVGSSVSRWPGEPGLKITHVQVLDGHGLPAAEVPSGEPLTIQVELTAELDGPFDCRLSILIMTLEGVGVCRHLSEPFVLTIGMGQTRTVELRYDRTLFASGEYVFSAAAFRFYDPDDTSTARRFDILSRSFRLKVAPRYKFEPGLLHHPARWVVPEAATPAVVPDGADAHAG